MTPLLAPFIGLILTQDPPSKAAEGNSCPQILIDAFMYRTTFKTARFTVRIEEERRILQPYVRRFRFEWAHGARYIVDLGDDHGMSFSNRETAEVPLGVFSTALPRSFFFNATNDEMWEYGMGRAVRNGPKMTELHLGGVPDPRTYGLRVGEMPRFSPEYWVAVFKKKEAGRIVISDADQPKVHVKLIGEPVRWGHSEIEWWIDKDKGPGVTCLRETIVHPDGRAELLVEMESTLERIDNMWWPRRIEYKLFRDGNGRAGLVTFDDIEFDRPTHAQSLDVDVMRIPIGTKVALRPEGGGRSEMARYVGRGKVISEDEWKEKKDDYDTSALEKAEALIDFPNRGNCPDWWNDNDDAYGLKDAATRPELWDLYVRRWALKRRTNHSWVAKEPLTDKQCQDARNILDECIKKAASSKSEDVAEHFQELKSRLDDLLTNAQRRQDNATWQLPKPPPFPMRPRKPVNPYPWNVWPGGPAIF